MQHFIKKKRGNNSNKTTTLEKIHSTNLTSEANKISAITVLFHKDSPINKSQNNHFRQANHHNQEFFRMTGVKYHNLLTRVKFNHSFRIPLILCLLLARFVYCPVTLLDIAQKQNFGLILMNQTHLYLFPQIKSGGPRYCC